MTNATQSRDSRNAETSSGVEPDPGLEGVVPGQTVSNPLSGERLTFIQTSEQSGETDVVFDAELRPIGVPGGMPHRHAPAEHFEVTEGLVVAFIAGQGVIRAGAGDVFDIPPGRWHVVIALKRTKARVTVSPGMRFDHLLGCGAALGSGDVRPATLKRLNRLLHEHDCVPRVP